MTKIVLEIDGGLDAAEADLVRQIMRDALGEFMSARSFRAGRETDPQSLQSAVYYVHRRYPDMGVDQQLRKANEVFVRKNVARKLRVAADLLVVQDIRPPEPVVPIAERVCQVMPTVFLETVEEEAKRLGVMFDESLKLDDSTQNDGTIVKSAEVPVPDIAFDITQAPGVIDDD